MNTELLVLVKKLSKHFDDHVILQDVSARLHKREFVALLGPSGCGKTVFLKILSGLFPQTSGEVEYNFLKQKNVSISMAFQKSPLFPWMNLRENLTVCMNNDDNLTERQKKKKAEAYLEKANLGQYQNFYPDEISGGMAQKVNVLRSFCCDADLILMDEPFVFLDFMARTELQKFTLEMWQDEKKAILFVTHNIHEAILLSDRIWIMGGDKGQIVEDVPVNLPRLRDVEEIRMTSPYLRVFKLINDVMRSEIVKKRVLDGSLE